MPLQQISTAALLRACTTTALLSNFSPLTLTAMDDNRYSAPQAEHQRALRKMGPARDIGAIIGAVIGGLLMPAWSLAAAVDHGSWHVIAPEPTDLVLMSAWFALFVGCVGSFVGAVARLFRSQ